MPATARTLGRNIANAVAGGAANLDMIQVIANQTFLSTITLPSTVGRAITQYKNEGDLVDI